MQKTLRRLSEEQKMASMVLMILDARCPRSSRNPILESVFTNKPVLYILNKEDLASVKITREWLDYYKNEGLDIISLSARTGAGGKKLLQAIRRQKEIFEKKYPRRTKTGHFRIVVVGVPNSGKSSIINLLSPNRSVKTGKKPGLTRGAQWLKIGNEMEVLDSPGVMLPRMDLMDSPWILGSVAAIRQEILPIEEVSLHLINYLLGRKLFPKELLPEGWSLDALPATLLDVSAARTVYPESASGEIAVEEPVGLAEVKEPVPAEDSLAIPRHLLQHVARLRGFLEKGGTPDTAKAAMHFLNLFREGKLGHISLEAPGDIVREFTGNEPVWMLDGES